ncbi:MAG: MOSC N-terminal beta barrel domain-containing protein [Antricoccus sp.]
MKDVTVAALRRYPVKSMLGEDLTGAVVTASGLEGDRVAAVIDRETGRVATAKHPRLWRDLLSLTAQWNDGEPNITLPDGDCLSIDDPNVDRLLSELLQREVALSTTRPEHASVGRPAPEDVIEAGADADLPFEILEIAQGTPGTNFVDFAPVHLISSATLAHVGAEMIRYRPNLVLDTPLGAPFAENDWVGREICIGEVRLSVIRCTPRCAVPTLPHGVLPTRTDAVRTVLQQNLITLPGFGPKPCLGAYAQVISGGMISLGDTASFQPAI